MGRSPSPDESNLKKGPWTPEEDQRLVDHISRHGHRNWKTLPKHAGLNRCGKSCRLRWTNYLRPDIKRGRFSDDEDRKIINLHSILGNKWSRIATELPGRTDNEIKNYWNTHLKKKLLRMGVDPTTHMPRNDFSEITHLVQLLGAANIGNLTTSWSNALSLQADASHMARIHLLQQLLQAMNASAVLNLKNTGLLGNRSLNPFEGLVNGTSALNDLEAFLMNPPAGLIPQAPTNLQGIANSWAGLEGGWNPEVLGSKNSSLTSSTIENPTENPLPPLVSASSGSFTDNIIESKIDPNKFSTSSANSTIFDAWEKLMDDETSDAYWKDMLQSTPSSSSPSPW